MLCPEGQHMDNVLNKEEDENGETKTMKESLEGDVPGSLELASFKSPKTWKKSISKFFRQQLRSTKSNEGDHVADSETFEEKQMSPEQKWQSLGKVFRRQSYAEHCDKAVNKSGECSTHCRRFAVRKVLSTVFGKTSKAPSPSLTQDSAN